MIKTRLVGLLSHAKKYIVYTILWQWAALLSQVIAVFTIADLLERVVYGAVTAAAVKRTIFTLAIIVVIRFFCERMGARQQEPFGRIYCYCVAAILLFHVLVNVGMTIGLMPVMGIPLPFMSYGGSSLIAFTILLFIAVRLDASTRQFSLNNKF